MTTSIELPAAVAAALAAPTAGERIRIDAAGIPFSALVWGDPGGRPLLLLHGVTSSARDWWCVGPALAATGRRIVAPDLPGHGQTGHWVGHTRFRDTARDLVAFAAAAGLVHDDLQVVAHSWGAVTAAAFPAVGLRPERLVLLDPPALPLALISQKASDPVEHHYDDLDDAIAAMRAQNPRWAEEDVIAKAHAVNEMDEAAVRAIVLDNGDWDGGLADLSDPAADGVPVWIVRGDQAAGGLLPDAWLPRFAARIGEDRIATIVGGPHSPHRTQPVETVAALIAALEAPAD